MPDIVTRAAEPGDARALVDLVARCYGDTYPGADYADAARLRELIASGDRGGVVALASEALIGHIAIRPSGGGDAVCEAGTTIVDPAERGRGLMRALALELAAECVRRGHAGFMHFPTTAHTVMQRASIAAGGRETGILLAYIPADTTDAAIGRAGTGRLAVTVVYQPLAAAPAQAAFVPARYTQLLPGLARELGLERTWQNGDAAASGNSELTRSFDPARSLARVAVTRIGADIATVAAELADLGTDLVHADLPMDDPAIDEAIDELVRAGFAFAAWLPNWAGADVLRLQRVRSPDPRMDPPVLDSAAAAALLEVIRADV